jgi:hypothetical protein
MLNEIAKKYVKDNTTELNALLTKLKPTFTETDKLQAELSTIDESDVKSIRRIGKALVGNFGSLYKALKNIHALRHNKRVSFYYQRALEYENGKVLGEDGKPAKSTADKLKNESELYVSDERKVYYAIEGYVEGIKSSVMFCQSLLKEIKTQQSQNDFNEEN